MIIANLYDYILHINVYILKSIPPMVPSMPRTLFEFSPGEGLCERKVVETKNAKRVKIDKKNGCTIFSATFKYREFCSSGI